MEPDKNPGTLFLPSEFYQMFWNDVSKPLLDALNYGFEIGKLSISQKRGIIKLIPKKSEELYYVKNWRPLTLLNCDYKIATKAIANRLKSHLHKLINNDQTGFLKGRFREENMRLIDSVINYTAVKKNSRTSILPWLWESFWHIRIAFYTKNTYFFRIWTVHCPMV